MKIRPLTGRVLVEIIPEETTSGGLVIPSVALPADEVQQRSRNPDKPPGRKARVLEIGPWVKLRCGLALMPEFGKGAIVVIGSHSGRTLQRETSRKLCMLKQSDVLAVL